MRKSRVEKSMACASPLAWFRSWAPERATSKFAVHRPGILGLSNDDMAVPLSGYAASNFAGAASILPCAHGDRSRDRQRALGPQPTGAALISRTRARRPWPPIAAAIGAAITSVIPPRNAYAE
jgi:hypothetical protein